MKFSDLFRRKYLTQEEKKLRNKQRLLGLISGVALALSFPPVPFPFSLLMFFALVPYLYVIDKKERLVDINRFSYFTFFIFNLFTVYWVGGWGADTDPFLMIAGAALLFFNPILFLIPSTLFYVSTRLIKPRWISFLLFPFYWVTYEYLYMITDASFPWLTLGNGLSYFTSYIQVVEFIGALGLSLLVIFINVLLFFVIKEKLQNKRIHYPSAISALLLIILPILFGVYTLETFELDVNLSTKLLPKKQIRVGLIQPNLNPWEKWQKGNIEELAELYLDMSQKAVDKGAELIIWPETALPVYLLDGSHQDVVRTIYDFAKRNNTYLLSGMPDFNLFFNKEQAPSDAKHNKDGDLYFTTYNGIMLFSPFTSQIQKYGKMKLVPFGERVPFVDVLPFLGDLIKWEVGISGWNKGKDTTVFTFTDKDSNAVYLNALVCFESVYPDLVAQFVQRGSQFISVVTNDSWYGNSSGPYQHKEIAVLRAVENRRSVVRAANGGISAIIDPLGKTLSSTKMYTKDIIVGDVPIETRITFFTSNPSVIPIMSSMISLWIFAMFLLIKLKRLLKL